jgi:uncharacterized protein (TIGR02145 family)
MLPKLFYVSVNFLFLGVTSFAQFNPDLTYGEVVDIEGNKYKTIKIGKQEWMAENLRTTKYNDGSGIPLVADEDQWLNNFNEGNTLQEPMMCWYINDQPIDNANKYGAEALYNWYAINPSTNGNKNVCPLGWHVPTDVEWTVLNYFLDPEAYVIHGRGINNAGGKMKSTGMQFWESPNEGATNSSGFSGLPGGIRNGNGTFDSIGNYGYWWSSSESKYDTRFVWVHSLTSHAESLSRSVQYKTSGLSVRCLSN